MLRNVSLSALFPRVSLCRLTLQRSLYNLIDFVQLHLSTCCVASISVMVWSLDSLKSQAFGGVRHCVEPWLYRCRYQDVLSLYCYIVATRELTLIVYPVLQVPLTHQVLSCSTIAGLHIKTGVIAIVICQLPICAGHCFLTPQ